MHIGWGFAPYFAMIERYTEAELAEIAINHCYKDILRMPVARRTRSPRRFRHFQMDSACQIGLKFVKGNKNQAGGL